MDLHELIHLERTEDPLHWSLPLEGSVLAPSGALHGGSGLAAAVEAMAGATGRPLVWATAQFLRHVVPPGVLDIRITPEVVGHQITQARAVVSLGVDEVLTAHAALGHRPSTIEAVWDSMPEAPSPEACPERVSRWTEPGLQQLWSARIARGRQFAELDGTPGPGRSASWYRIPGGGREVCAGDLAVLGDFLFVEFSEAAGQSIAGNSLDNTIRVGRTTTTEWILLDAHIHSITNGFGTGTAQLWAQDGTHLGTASQSLVLRRVGSNGSSERTQRRLAGDKPTQ